MIDIDRVQDVLEGKVSGRRCGKTYARLIVALNHVDMVPPQNGICFFVCLNEHCAVETLRTFKQLAIEMEFEEIKQLSPTIIEINHRQFEFLSIEMLKLQKYVQRGSDALPFFDVSDRVDDPFIEADYIDRIEMELMYAKFFRKLKP